MLEADKPAPGQTKNRGTEIVFIDTSVADWETLVEGVDPQGEMFLVPLISKEPKTRKYWLVVSNLKESPGENDTEQRSPLP